MYMQHICINKSWHLITYNGWYAIKPNQSVNLSRHLKKIKGFKLRISDDGFSPDVCSYLHDRVFFYSFMTFQVLIRPVGWGCKIRWLHLCKGVRPPPPTWPPVGRGYDPWYLRTRFWWLSSTRPGNWVVKSLATHPFGTYWTSRAVA